MDLQEAKRFKEQFGACPFELERKRKEEERQAAKEFEEMIAKETENYHRKDSQAYQDIRINWDIVAREEANGYEWPTMPWLPAPSEREGKNWAQLNKMAYELREIHNAAKMKGE